MDEQRTFVGRQVELKRFRQVLADPAGRTVVVGHAGMGKTWLLPIASWTPNTSLAL